MLGTDDAVENSKSPGGGGEEGGESGDKSGKNHVGGEKTGAAAMLSLRSYVKQRQEGSAGSKGGWQSESEEKKAEELRKTALLGPVLNDGERWVVWCRMA